MPKENLSKVVVKNSAYDFISNSIAKLGGMIFTIFILARLLGPELFGIYNLAFSVIAIFLVFTDLGISTAVTRYVSEALGRKNKQKARSYFKYFFKLKVFVALFAMIPILLIAKPLAYNFYQKPLLFLPLIFASFYIVISSIASLPQVFLYALKDLKKLPKIQLLEQTSKILLGLGAIFLFTYNFEVPGIYLAMAISSSFVFLYSSFIVLKKDKSLIIGKRTKIEKPKILKYTGFVALSSISLVFFASIDTLMLAKFVESAFLGYYRAALGLVLSIGALISTRAILMPVFTQIHKGKLERAFDKVSKYNLMISIPATIGLLFISKTLIPILYGSDFAFSSIPLYALSFLIIIASLISLYRPLFQAKEKPKILAYYIIIALVINIILNYILIKSLIGFGQEYAILGAALATLISRTILLLLLSKRAKKEFKTKISKQHFIKPLIATIVMAIFLLVFNYIISINLIWLIIEIILATLVYFATLFLIKGLTKEDLQLLKYIKFPR